MTNYPENPDHQDLIARGDTAGARLAADLEALYAAPVPGLRFIPPERSPAPPRRWRWWQPAFAAGVAAAGLAVVLVAPSLWHDKSRTSAEVVFARAAAAAETDIPAAGAAPYHLVATSMMPGQSSTKTTETWYADASHIRKDTEFDPSNGTPEFGFLTNGDLTWMYDAQGEYRAVRGPTSELGRSLDLPAAGLAQVLGEHTKGCQIAREDGEEAVAGRTAYKIIVEAAACTGTDADPLEFGRLSVWVDKESFLPLKTIQQYGPGEEIRYSYEVTRLDYGDPIPESVFIYQGPPGTTVQDVSSLSEASYALLPSKPDTSLVVESGQVQAGDSITVRVVLEASKPGIRAFTIDLYHDPNLLTAVSCDSNPAGLCNPQLDQSAPAVDPEAAFRISRFTGASVTPWVGEIEVGSVTFQAAVGGKGASSLDAVVLTLSDPYGRDLQAGQIRNGVIEIVPPGNPD